MAHKGAVYLLKHRAPVKMAVMVFLICLAGMACSIGCGSRRGHQGKVMEAAGMPTETNGAP